MPSLIPPIDTLCVTIRQAPGIICIDFPGGAQICAQLGYETGDPSDITRALFAQVNSALAPLAPIFSIIEVAGAVFNCIKAIPDALGPPPDPSKLGSCVTDLQKLVEKLLKLIPQLSIPAMVKSLIGALITYLYGVKAQLQAMIRKQLQIIAAATRASSLNNVKLQIAVDCAQGIQDAQLVNLNTSLQPLNRFIGMISIFMQIAGLGCIPPLGNIGAISDAMLAPIDAIIAILLAIQAAIPDIPSVQLGDGQTGDC